MGEATSAEVAAAVARLDRSQGGRSLPVGWQTRLAPRYIWGSLPPSKDDAVRVIVLPLDERPA